MMHKKLLPTSAGVVQWPYFMMKVSDMKAWQLYVGQTFWVALVGFFFWFVNMTLARVGIESPTVHQVSTGVEQLATGEGVDSSYIQQRLFKK